VKRTLNDPLRGRHDLLGLVRCGRGLGRGRRRRHVGVGDATANVRRSAAFDRMRKVLPPQEGFGVYFIQRMPKPLKKVLMSDKSVRSV
jgi:hypothetical protein